MSLPVDITIANPDPAANPTTLTQLVVILRTLFTAVVTGTYKPYVTGSSPPAVGDQDKAWIRSDGAGRPMGTYLYYAGHWRRSVTGLPTQLAFFQGNPATYFDGTGLGIVEGDWDGWAICNGSNGTTDLSDKFICIGGVYTGGVWKSDVSGTSLASGGVKDITLTNANTYRPARTDLTVGRLEATGNAPDATGGLYGSNMSFPVELIAADAGNTTPTAIPTLPPYIVMGLAKWVGYA